MPQGILCRKGLLWEWTPKYETAAAHWREVLQREVLLVSRSITTF